MTYRRDPDRFTKKAKSEGFVARSIYKLEEIDRRAKLLKPGMRVLDLGAAPGSWTQYAAPKLGSKGRLVAVDLVPLRVAVPPTVKMLEMDIFGDLEALEKEGPFELVLSDMAPKTTGISYGDAARSHELVERVLDVCERVLIPNGKLVAKIFQGEGFEEVRNRMRKLFGTVKLIKPEASRKESVETFLYAIDFRGGAKVDSKPVATNNEPTPVVGAPAKAEQTT